MSSTLIRDAYTLQALPDDPEGTVVALVSVFNNIDLVGDRVNRNAFDIWLMQRRAAGKGVPILWAHDWKSTESILGYANPENIRPTDDGLVVKFKLDTSIPWAKAVYQLLQQQAAEFSFGYQVVRQKKAADGANDLLEVTVSEITVCIKGINPATRVLSVKGDALAEKAARLVSVDSIVERIEAEEAIRAICTEEGISDPAEEQAKAETAAEERRKANALAMSRQLQTAQAIHAGVLDEVRIGPRGNVISGPIRAAQQAKAEAREKATLAEAREQRDRDRAKAEATAAAARANGPSVGNLRGRKVTS